MAACVYSCLKISKDGAVKFLRGVPCCARTIPIGRAVSVPVGKTKRQAILGHTPISHGNREAASAAQRATEQTQGAQLCLQADGGVKRADPHYAFVGSEAAAPVDEEDELMRLRRERKAQLQKESVWKKQGHGSLRELVSETEFVETIAPHERALVLLDDGAASAGEVCRKVLGRLASKHLEAQFCWLPAERAFFLTQMIDLQGLPTIFVLRYGEVTRHLPPSQLFSYSSASSPLFPKHLRNLLHRSGAIENVDDDSDSASDDDSDETFR